MMLPLRRVLRRAVYLMADEINHAVVSVYRDAVRRRRSPLLAFEQAVTALIDRMPSTSREEARRRLARLLVAEEGFDPKLIGLGKAPDRARSA